jgi:NADH-quinone oxidoreductase subunit F
VSDDTTAPSCTGRQPGQGAGLAGRARLACGDLVGTPYGVSGNVQRPGVYELPLGLPVREIIFEHAGGLHEGRTLKAVIPGDSSAPILTVAEAMAVNSDFDALQRVGSMAGSGGMMVLDDTVCIVQSTYILAEFYHDESCGQCSPCREGTGWMEKILHRIEHGEGRPGEVDLLLYMGTNIFGRTICPLGDAAVWPVESAINKFRAEFDYHVRKKKCRNRPGGADYAAAGRSSSVSG